MALFDLLALLIILLAFLWPLIQSFLLRRRVRQAPQVKAPIREEVIYRDVYPEEEIAPQPDKPEPGPAAMGTEDLTQIGGRDLPTDLTQIDERELRSDFEEIDLLSDRFVEIDSHYLGNGPEVSRIRTLLGRIPSGQEMILLHEILSPPKSL